MEKERVPKENKNRRTKINTEHHPTTATIHPSALGRRRLFRGRLSNRKLLEHVLHDTTLGAAPHQITIQASQQFQRRMPAAPGPKIIFLAREHADHGLIFFVRSLIIVFSKGVQPVELIDIIFQILLSVAAGGVSSPEGVQFTFGIGGFVFFAVDPGDLRTWENGPLDVKSASVEVDEEDFLVWKAVFVDVEVVEVGQELTEVQLEVLA